MATSNVDTLMNLAKIFIPCVDTAWPHLLANNHFYKYIPKMKMNSLADRLLEEARENLSNGDFRLALECYTQAIAYAENESNKLSECYNQRANFLQEMNYWETAGEDIKRSFRCSMINIDTESLLEPLRKSLQDQSRRHYPAPVRKLPRIPDYEINESFPCSTTNITIVNGETKGQRVIATSRLHISENIVVEQPLVIASGEHESLLFCYECMLFCLNPVPCSSCSQVTFCGEFCKESAWRRYHQYECNIQFITDKHKQYRLAVKIVLSFHDYIDLREDNAYCPEEYRDLLDRGCNLNDLSDEVYCECTVIAAQIVYALEQNTTFFTDITNPEKFNICKGLFLRLMLIVNEKEYPFIKSYDYVSNETQKNFDVSFVGIYPFAKHFRTGCAPNVSVDFCETTLVVKTLRIIEPGEELFIAGDYDYTTTSKEERQAIFQKKYSTNCKCEACENNWPLSTDLYNVCDLEVLCNIEKLYKSLEEALCFDIFLEYTHAVAKDSIGVYLVRPSLEWYVFQCLLIQAHRRLCTACENVMAFLRRK